MGWGKTLLLGEIASGQTLDDLEKHLESVRKRQQMQMHVDRGQDEELRALQRENGELKLYLLALAGLLISKSVIDRDEFARLIETIDAADGQNDGQYAGAIALQDS